MLATLFKQIVVVKSKKKANKKALEPLALSIIVLQLQYIKGGNKN